jgi:hypothetical protein
MAYEYFYQGRKSALEPIKSTVYTGANIAQGAIGGTTSIQTANQLQEVSNLLNTGMKTIEVSTVNPEVFDMIPKQHLQEINRLAKLTNAETTMHAPMIEPSGFTQQGWNEQNRELSERQLKDVVIRAHELSPNKPMPITIHSSGIPGTEMMPTNMLKKELLTDEERKMGAVPTQMIAVNQETGELIPMRREIKYEMTGEKEVWTPEQQLNSANHTEWIQKLTSLEFYKKEADESMEKGADPLRAQLFLNNVQTSLRPLFERAAKYGDDRTKGVLKEISKEWQEYGASEEKSKLTDVEKLHLRSALIGETIHKMAKVPGFNLYKPVEEFAIDKASETFSNVAFEAWKKFGNKAPIISVENPPYGFAVSTAKDLKNLIEKSREKFIEKAVDKGMSKSEAERAAENMIGATWDTSHISMMRKQGFKPEELVKETKIIAPVVKHVHLNDNFGGTHTDLPPGMGSVPIGDVMKELKNADFKGKHIFEGGNFFQHFKTAPHTMVLEAMGSPVYTTSSEQTWQKVYGTQGIYSSGYGPFLPDQHFSMYGAGFSSLPAELGGQAVGKQSRFSGTPMA